MRISLRWLWLIFSSFVILGFGLLLLLPVDVPDTNSPPNANGGVVVNGTNTPGQSFVPYRDGLNRIDIILAVEQPTDQAAVTFGLEKVPFASERTIVKRVSDFPVGVAKDFRPGSITERWYSFSFEPVPDSAGRNMYFSLEGKNVQGANSIGLLAFFHNEYDRGEAYLNGSPINAHIVFRAYTRGRVIDVIGVALDNLATGRPQPFDTPAIYLGLGLAYAVVAVLFIMLIRTKHSEMTAQK